MEREEYDYLELAETADSSWQDGYQTGKDEVLGSLLAEAEMLLPQIDMADLPPGVDELVELVQRWVIITQREEA
jgi:hypothetical protein